MSPEIRHLVNPESLSETALMDHLKRRCIDLLDLKKYKKSDLIGMFKRLAMPLPQRKYNEAKCFGKRLSELRLHRKIPTAIEADTKLYESTITSLNNSDDNVSACKRLKSSSDVVSDCASEMENTRLTNSLLAKNGLKRTVEEDEDSAEEGLTKRQKITWP